MTATNSLETALPAAQAAWGGDPYPANGRAPAAPTPPEAAIHAHLQGEVSGQVAVGNYIVQIGRNEGGVVNVALGQPALPRALPTPVLLRPDPFLDLLDREVEVNTVLAAVRSTRRIEFYGQPGLGKTALLRHLGHHALTQAFPDGVLSLQARRKPLADLLQSLFDAFYERDPDFKPTDVQIRRALQGKRAIIFLDDVEWEREDVEALIEAAPDCTFLLAAPKRHWWGEGRALALHGLPLDESLKLMERELGRPLKPEERPVAQVLCTQMEGHPLQILQAAALVREQGGSLGDLITRAQTAVPHETLTAQLLASLSEPERQTLAAIAAAGGAPLHGEHLPAITGIEDVAPILQSLLRRGLVRANSPSYSPTGALAQTLWQTWDLTPWAARVLAKLTQWAEAHRRTPARLLEQADALSQMLEWATEAGRWSEAVRLARALEGALALGKCWGLWGRALGWALHAARQLGNQAAEAWALHQLGTRALCLADANTARTLLIQALRLREALRDRAGVAVTRHNLTILLGPPEPPRRPPEPPAPAAPPTPAAPGAWLIVLGLAGVAAILIVALGLSLWLSVSEPTLVPATDVPVLPSATPTLTPTGTPPATVTPTSTSTLVPTETPTSTGTPTATATPSQTATPCGPPPAWVIYIVQRGDNLFRIGQATGTTAEALRLGNCLTSDVILTGQRLYVPILPPTSTFTPTPTHTPTATLTPFVAPDLKVAISAPLTITSGSTFRVIAQVFNVGRKPALGTASAGTKGYMIDVVLSSDLSVPPGWARYSDSYAEDVLLKGGRFSNTADVEAGKSVDYFTDARSVPRPIIPRGGITTCARGQTRATPSSRRTRRTTLGVSGFISESTSSSSQAS